MKQKERGLNCFFIVVWVFGCHEPSSIARGLKLLAIDEGRNGFKNEKPYRFNF